MSRIYNVLWVVMFFALMAAGTMSLVIWGSDKPVQSDGAYMALGVSWLIVLGGFALQYRKDKYDTAKFAAYFGFPTAVVLVIVLMNAEQPHPGAWAAAVGAALFGGLGVWWIRNIQDAPEVVPNLLAQEFGAKALLERDGVQFVTTISGDTSLQFFAQNTFDAPRTVTLTVKPEVTLFRRGRATVPSPTSLKLDPLAVGKIAVPIHVTRPGRVRIGLDVSVEGSGGKRVRRWRAEEYIPKVSGWAALFGVHGGGVRIDFTAAAPTAHPSNDASAGIVWAPTEDDLARAHTASAA